MKGKRKINNNIIRIIKVLLSIIIILGIIYICYYFYYIIKDNKVNNNIDENVDIYNLDDTNNTEQKSEKILKLEELNKQNSDIIGWLEIKDTNINYPVLQTTDNDYYLTHNYKKEYSPTGSLFLDKNFDLINGSSNYLIYGHRTNQGIMFEDLIKYSNEDFYKSHTTINFTTLNEDSIYEILSVFYSRVYYKNEKNVFRYYYFVNANNEQEYNDFVNNCKKVSIYDTGVTAQYGEQLLTLSTCEYSQEDGRFVVVCKKIKN